MKSRRRLVILYGALLMVAPLHLRAQTWADSLTTEERFWSRSGGQARQLALAAGGFGMLGDSIGLKTIGVNPFSVDPMFMLSNPAYAAHYRSDLWFDAGLNSGVADGGLGQQFGATFSLSDDFTAGLILGRGDDAGFSLVNPNMFNQLSSLGAGYNVPIASNTWEVFGALRTGSFDWGVGLSYASSSSTTNIPSGTDTKSRQADFKQLSLNAGTLFRGDDGLLFDLGATLLLPSITTGTTVTGDISLSTFGVNTRMFIPLKKDFYLVPIFDFYGCSGKSTLVGTPKDLSSGSNFDGGIGVNFWEGGVHVMSGVSFGHYSTTQPAITGASLALNKSQTIIPRWTIGAEWPALKWLTLRVGYFASTGSETQDSRTSDTSNVTTTVGKPDLYSPVFGSSASGVTLGAGFQIGRLTIDATVNDQMLRTGPLNILQGTPLGFVTLGYRFD